MGIIFTEHAGLLDRAVALLQARPQEVESIAYTDRPFTGRQLVSLRMEPRTIYMSEVFPPEHPNDNPFRRFGVLNEVYPLIYRRR